MSSVNTSFWRAVDYRTNQLNNTFSKYDRTVSKNIRKMSKRMTIQIKPPFFEPIDPIYIIGFLYSFKLLCDTYGIYERAERWLFHFFSTKSASFALHKRLASKRKARTRVASTGKTTTFTKYTKDVNYLLKTHATDEHIADTKDKITTFIQPLN